MTDGLMLGSISVEYLQSLHPIAEVAGILSFAKAAVSSSFSNPETSTGKSWNCYLLGD